MSVAPAEKGFPDRRVTDLALGGAEADGEIEGHDRIGVGGLRVEVKSLGVTGDGRGSV